MSKGDEAKRYSHTWVRLLSFQLPLPCDGLTEEQLNLWIQLKATLYQCSDCKREWFHRYQIWEEKGESQEAECIPRYCFAEPTTKEEKEQVTAYEVQHKATLTVLQDAGKQVKRLSGKPISYVE